MSLLSYIFLPLLFPLSRPSDLFRLHLPHCWMTHILRTTSFFCHSSISPIGISFFLPLSIPYCLPTFPRSDQALGSFPRGLAMHPHSSPRHTLSDHTRTFSSTVITSTEMFAPRPPLTHSIRRSFADTWGFNVGHNTHTVLPS